MKNLIIALFVLFTGCFLLENPVYAQTKLSEKQDTAKPAAPKRRYTATKIVTPPIIDGKLDDVAWQNAPVTTDFTQEEPKLGQPARFKTEVRILYDDEAIYVSAFMHDTNRDSVMRELSVRDEDSNSDWFLIAFDTYKSGINALCFAVAATNVQGDFKITNNGDDKSWNAVWFSGTEIRNDGWTTEFKIPYSALRFSDAIEQEWLIQIGHERRQSRETSWWSSFDPNKNGFMTQAGILDGIKGIKPPVRLALLPFVSGSVTTQSGPNTPASSTLTGRAGLDLKYGINDAFTLDMTLIPDFGQVRSDDKVLNLGAYEVRYDEQRPFFTEGLELFSKGDLFYSRRIGGVPYSFSNLYSQIKSNERVVFAPTEGQILNSTKISGRTKSGLGVGVLNSITNHLDAIVRNDKGEERKIEIDPLTNYNVLVLDQNLKNNSSATFINTNVWREGEAQESNVTGGILNLNNKKNTYGLFLNAQLSQQYATGFKNVDLGQKYELWAGKTSGKWQYSVSYWQIDDHFDPNDLGFQSYNNERGVSLQGSFRELQPKIKNLQNFRISTNFNYNRLMVPDRFTNLSMGLNVNMTTKQFFSAGAFFYTQPIATADYFEPRVWGKVFLTPSNHNIGGWISSDYRKRFALDINGNFRFYEDNLESRYRANISLSPRFRVNNQLSFNADIESYNFINDIGFSTFTDNQPTFGRRDVHTISNTVRGKYIFNNKMGLVLRFRHYWSTASYKYYNYLTENGGLTAPFTEVNGNKIEGNQSFNAFTVDAGYSWVFAPGSEATLVWKQAIYQSDRETNIDYLTDVAKTFNSSQSNTLSLKILYYVDYQNIKGAFAKKKL